MLKNNLNGIFYKVNATKGYFNIFLHSYLNFLKKIILFLFFVSNMVFTSFDLGAESLGREIQNYVRSETSLDARKRKAYENSQKEKGLLIKRYLINKSALQSKKGKSDAATKEMVESGLLTLDMIKNNRWFVRKNVQTSNSKSSDYEKSNNISRDALKMTKYRARITGTVKPNDLFSENSSRNALTMTRSRARISGPVKPGTIYPEYIGRDAKRISKTRAVETSPVKPEKLYSEQVSRDVKKISIKTSKDYTTYRRDMSVYSDIIESMSKRPVKNIKPVNVENTYKK